MTWKQWMLVVLGVAVVGGIVASLIVFAPGSQEQNYDESLTVTAGYPEYYELTATDCTVEGIVVNKGDVDLQFLVEDPFGSPPLIVEIIKAYTQYDFSFRVVGQKVIYRFIFVVSQGETSADIHLHLR